MNFINDLLRGDTQLSDRLHEIEGKEADVLRLLIEMSRLDLIPPLVSKVSVLANGVSPIEYAIRLGKVDVIEVFLKSGVNAELYPQIFSTPNNDILRLVLWYGANQDLTNSEGETVLMKQRRELEMVGELLCYGIEVNLQDKNGYTALHRLAISDEPEIVRLLMSAGSDPMLETNMGYRAYDYAVLVGSERYAEAIKQWREVPSPSQTS